MRTPHIARGDVKRAVETIPRTLYDAQSVLLVSHKLFTNGISYIDIAVPIDVLEPSDYLYSLLSRAAVSSGLFGHGLW
ncbi:hypothetical protein MASR2M78_16870 [Treponema sp.]